MNRFSTISTNDYVYIYWWKAGETVELGVSRIAAFVVEHDFTIDKEDSYHVGRALEVEWETGTLSELPSNTVWVGHINDLPDCLNGTINEWSDDKWLSDLVKRLEGEGK